MSDFERVARGLDCLDCGRLLDDWITAAPFSFCDFCAAVRERFDAESG
jgi:hypothetical protein